MRIHICVCVCVHVCVCACMCLCMCVCACVDMHGCDLWNDIMTLWDDLIPSILTIHIYCRMSIQYRMSLLNYFIRLCTY